MKNVIMGLVLGMTLSLTSIYAEEDVCLSLQNVKCNTYKTDILIENGHFIHTYRGRYMMNEPISHSVCTREKVDAVDAIGATGTFYKHIIVFSNPRYYMRFFTRRIKSASNSTEDSDSKVFVYGDFKKGGWISQAARLMDCTY